MNAEELSFTCNLIYKSLHLTYENMYEHIHWENILKAFDLRDQQKPHQ